MKIVDNYVLGMDFGSTNAKAVILGEDGVKVAQASRPVRYSGEGRGVQEQDANDWWQSTVEIFRSLSQQAGQTVVQRIRGIAISSHTVSMLALDEKGSPVRNAITYRDGRSYAEMKEITDRIGYDRFVNIVGGQPAVSFLPNKLLWYKRHEPQNFARTRYYLQASSYINYRLTGVMSTDIDQAQRTQCWDINQQKWSKEIGDVIGIDLDAVLPSPVAVDEIIGYVSEEAAEETGLIPGIPVMAGCSDAMASLYATGMHELGDCGESSGTSSLVFVGSDVKSASDVPIVTRPCSIPGMPYVFDGPITTTGGTLKWFIDTFGAEERSYCAAHDQGIYGYLNEKATEAEPGSGGLLFFPYLLGERAPLWNEYARGMFIGLSMDTSRAELIRSVFEGTAFALRHVIETAKASGGKCTSLRICGGGAKSPTWSRIKASMLHCPVYVLDENSGDVPVGDCLLAGQRVGVFQSLEDGVNKAVRIKEVIEPDPEWEKAYDALYPYFIKFYEDLDADLRSFRDVMDSFEK